MSYDLAEYQNAFVEWMQSYSVVYTSENFHLKFVAFKANMDFVQSWNNQSHSHKVHLNHLADLTTKEYKDTYLGFLGSKLPKTTTTTSSSTTSTVTPPTVLSFVNWTAAGVVTPVKNQGQCGSCFAFSATGAVEAIHALGTGHLVSLSEQNIIDCTQNPSGNQGCAGGYVDLSFGYIVSNDGIDLESSYAYTAKTGKTCKYSQQNVGASITGYRFVNSGSELELELAITLQPVSVAIDASRKSFMLYQSGVYSDPKCSTTNLDHAVLAVGYGVDASGVQYYIIKNSWGTTWGENGYFLLKRNAGNTCGVATSALYPQIINDIV